MHTSLDGYSLLLIVAKKFYNLENESTLNTFDFKWKHTLQIA